MDLRTFGRAMRAVFVVTLLWAAAIAAISESAYAQFTSTTSYFPTSSTTDGRMLAIIGSAMQSFDGSEMKFTITVDPNPTAGGPPAVNAGFTLDVFDGDNGGMWDYGTSGTLQFTLYGDPQGLGTYVDTMHQFAQVDGSAMTNNGWSTAFSYWFPPTSTTNTTTIEHRRYAQNPLAKFYRYLLVVKATSGSVGQYWNGFKLKITGLASVTSKQFQFATIITDDDDALVVYPNWVRGTSTITNFTPVTTGTNATTYDGTWKFFMDVPKIDYTTGPSNPDTTWVEIWDGDFDFGQYDGSATDLNDDNSSGVPAWASAGAVAEGVPTNGDRKKSSTGVPFLDGTRTTGNPADDHYLAVYRRTPFLYPDDDGTTDPKGIRYWLTDPLGTHYFNNDPSGNLEWERFRVGLVGITPSDNVAKDIDAYNGLPLGVWSVEIDGADVLNFNALNTSHSFCGQDASGNSVCPSDVNCGNLVCSIAPGSTAQHTMIVGRTGVYTWGTNNRAQLGIDNNQDQVNPQRVLKGAYPGSTYLGDNCNPAVMGAVGAEASMVMMRDGSVYTWGDNGKGQLGDGSTSWRRTPVRVVKGAAPGTTYLGDYSGNPVQAISMGKEHAAALMESGVVYAWGNNWKGEVGDSTLTQRNSPVAVRKGAYSSTGTQLGSDPTNPIVQISMGDGYSLALDKDGIVYAWGYNNFGQLGDGTTTDRREPVKVLKGAYTTTGSTAITYLGEDPSNPVIMISAGGGHAIALTQDGRVWSWGGNMQGQLGDGSTTARTTPVAVLDGAYDDPSDSYSSSQLGDNPANRIVFFSAGGTGGTSNQGHNIVQDSRGMVYSWDDNRLGELGIGTSGSGTDRTSPVKILAGASGASGTYLGDNKLLVSITAHMTHTVALVGDCQSVYSFGQGNGGRLGDGYSVDRTTPVAVAWGGLEPMARFVNPPLKNSDWTTTGAQFEPSMVSTLSGSQGGIQKGVVGTGTGAALIGVRADASGRVLNIGIEAGGNADVSFTIYSMGGESIALTPATFSLVPGTQTLNAQLPDGLANGTYLLRMNCNGNTSMQRFVLAR